MLKDKVIIVTGATRGIGLSIASHCAQQGAKVVVCSRNQDDCDRVAKQINADHSVETLGLKLDVSSLDDVQSGINQIKETFGRIDVLVNNAGITKDNLLLRLTKDDWDNVIDINLGSVFNTTKSVLKTMLKQRSGRIINITSVVGLMGNPGQTNYAASKAGVIGFTKSIAKEIGVKGITCNAVAPGFIDTDMTSELPEEYMTKVTETIPLRRLGQAEEVANLVVFLASDQSSYITGQVISVDGGIYM